MVPDSVRLGFRVDPTHTYICSLWYFYMTFVFVTFSPTVYGGGSGVPDSVRV